MVVESINQEKGFTLIELMLASALLMTVMFAGYYGYSLYSQKWQKRVDEYWQSTNLGIGIDALNKLLISANNYVVKNDDGKESVFFEANDNKIKFISNSPIMSEGTALVEIEAIDINGLKQIIYREKNLANYPLYLTSEIELLDSWQHQVLLLNNIEKISWNFYGWTSFQDALKQAEITESAGSEELRKSYQVHDYNIIRVLPVHVHISIEMQEQMSEFTVEMPNHSVFSVIANLRNDA